MMNWEKDSPQDLDLHIIAVKKFKKFKTCRTYFDRKNSCEKISLDLDNTRGGQNGAETITLQDNSMTNGVKTDIMNMEASSVDKSAEYDIKICNY